MMRSGGEGEGEVHLQPWLQPLAALFAERTQAVCVEALSLAYISVDAGSVQGLANVFPSMRGEARMILAALPLLCLSSTQVAAAATKTGLVFVCGMFAVVTFPEGPTLRIVNSSPSYAELDIYVCDVEPLALPLCAALPELRVLYWNVHWGKWSAGIPGVYRASILEACRAASAHPARKVDLELKVGLRMSSYFPRKEKERMGMEVQRMRDEWQAERRRLQTAANGRVGVGGEVHLQIDSIFDFLSYACSAIRDGISQCRRSYILGADGRRVPVSQLRWKKLTILHLRHWRCSSPSEAAGAP